MANNLSPVICYLLTDDMFPLEFPRVLINSTSPVVCENIGGGLFVKKVIWSRILSSPQCKYKRRVVCQDGGNFKGFNNE